MVTSLRSKWAVGKAVRAGRAVEGAYLNRYVTDEQRGRRPIFIATLWAGASWLFFRVARSTRMTQIWVLYRQSGSDRLEKQPTDLRQYTCYFGDRTLDSCSMKLSILLISAFSLAATIRSLGMDDPPRAPVHEVEDEYFGTKIKD